ncbi:hypothetical protein OS493_001134 [Desmophyllum pertusum]|uniref:Uncharacterized protein n=1 Tax=Desmophyllum pertusum TaxID=174260 RepID=A0A9W9ZUJ8_9CNID|nr:hypothetical protein OS493_001134 [Desmophyllum pertusum]
MPRSSTGQPLSKSSLLTSPLATNWRMRYKDSPKFAFLSHGVISHDNVNTVGYADDDLKAVLQMFEKDSFLNNTLLIIFADHGARFSGLRKTIQGKLEESGIVTGQSLFSRIDEKNRTCASAGVEDHWCPCLDLETVSIDEPIVKEAAEFVARYVNNLTSQSNELTKLCQLLVLKEVKTAFREMPKEAMQRFHDTKNGANDWCDACEAVMGAKAENNIFRDTLYQVQLVTSPN